MNITNLKKISKGKQSRLKKITNPHDQLRVMSPTLEWKLLSDYSKETLHSNKNVTIKGIKSFIPRNNFQRVFSPVPQIVSLLSTNKIENYKKENKKIKSSRC